jgi:hypothetical protein
LLGAGGAFFAFARCFFARWRSLRQRLIDLEPRPM